MVYYKDRVHFHSIIVSYTCVAAVVSTERMYTKHGPPVHGPPLWARSMDFLSGPPLIFED